MTCKKYEICYLPKKEINNAEETQRYFDSCCNYGIGCVLAEFSGIEFKVLERIEENKQVLE